MFAKKQPITHLIVGLGNPGPKYMKTRHNVGYMTLDFIMACADAEYTKTRFHSLTGEVTLGDHRFLAMKPETFMNRSGEAVSEAAAFYKIPPENVIVISDDTSLPVGKMRIRKSGSAGGHNGLKNIIEHLGSDNFPRIKIGIGNRPEYTDLADYVLGVIPPDEMALMKKCAENCSDAAALIADGKSELAMNKYN